MSYIPQVPNYQTPGGYGYGPPAPTGQLTAVAICMIVTGAWNFFISVIHLATQIFGMASGAGTPPAGGDPGSEVGFYLGFYGSVIFDVIGILACPLIIIGAICMLRKRGFVLARTACGLSCIPLLGCCCIGHIAFGIWGLVLLARQDVKNIFA